MRTLLDAIRVAAITIVAFFAGVFASLLPTPGLGKEVGIGVALLLFLSVAIGTGVLLYRLTAGRTVPIDSDPPDDV